MISASGCLVVKACVLSIRESVTVQSQSSTIPLDREAARVTLADSAGVARSLLYQVDWDISFTLTCKLTDCFNTHIKIGEPVDST